MTFVVGFGGTTRAGSSSERALRAVLDATGAETELFAAADLDFPLYTPGVTLPDERVQRFLDSLRRADGIIISSPGYHGGVSGLVKNAIDWVEELRGDARPYFDGRPVGLIVVADGWQATITTLTSLRSIVHALRGWPTPLGVAINAAERDADPGPQLELLAAQVASGSRTAPPRRT
ncbi:MAG: NAD(P)H-dependent oxidoreductase [Solirubrobacteraceae bacterium]